MKIAGFEPGTL